MSGEVFGKFSVKLTRAINTQPDAFGVGMRGILCITLSVPPPGGDLGERKALCVYALERLNFKGKPQCLDAGPCRLEKIR